jgi:septal ring factor EnvC (AmiA/AmiB activator)
VATDRDREAELRRTAEFVRRTRARIADGRQSLHRLQHSVRQTNEHIGSMAAWIDETERHLQAARRDTQGDERA